MIYKEEAFELVGICMEIHAALGYGFLEIVYKDALELELVNRIVEYEREKEYSIIYKGATLKHKFYADFVISNKIILEIKAIEGVIIDTFISKTINYLKVSNCKLGLIINFGRTKLDFKRIVL
jgi:GxxExxY protein